MAKISIITATLNRPSLLNTCHCIDQQDFHDWHHYVIGDGLLPVDYSHEQRTTIGFSKPIGAAQPALNMPEGTPNPILSWALQHLELGEYVCFLDDDNIYKPNFLSTMLNVLSSNPDSGIAICAVENHRGDWQDIDGFPEYRRCDNSGFLARSDIAKAIGFPSASPEKECVQDFEFIRACAEKSGWVHIPERLVIFGSSPNPPPGRGGIKLLDSWSLPVNGVRLIHQGKLEEGIRALTEASEFDKEDAWTLWNLGEAYLYIGHYENAIETLNKWRIILQKVEKWPNDWIHYCFSLASFLANDISLGDQHLNLAISLARNNKFDEKILLLDNTLNLGLYSLLKGQISCALRYYKNALEQQPDQILLKEALWNLKILDKAIHLNIKSQKVVALLESFL